MRLLHTRHFTFEDFLGSNIPVYAVVSHRWSEQELSYQSFLRDKEQYISGHLGSYGWMKIIKAAELALQCNLQWIWFDTICINKESSAELTESINSMYDWYYHASICFVFLPDVHCDEAWTREVISRPTFTAEVDMTHLSAENNLMKQVDLGRPIFQPVAYMPVRMYEDEFVQSVWFLRSWTLQELLAPGSVIFFNSKFQPIGTRHTLASLIEKATEIPLEFLEGSDGSRSPVTAACIAERMRWASQRDATRIEDKAYSMLGLFQVNLPLLYGEGYRAFRRLQIEIIKESNDESILAWMSGLASIRGLQPRVNSPVLSRSTAVFSHTRAMKCAVLRRKHYEVTNMGLRFTVPVYTAYGANKSSPQEDPTLLFPLNCFGACTDSTGRIIKGLLALLIIIDNQLSHQDLKIFVGRRFGQLLISEDITDQQSYGADAESSTLFTLDRNAPISTRRWISIATGERQSFDLLVDPVQGSVRDEYSLYLKL